MNYRYTLPTLALMVLGMAACGGSDDAKDRDAAQTKDEIAVIEVTTATVQDVDQVKEYTATVEAFNTNNISPSSPNRIKSITVEAGDHVSRGQTLVIMDNTNASQLKVTLDQLERDYNRAVQLLNIGSGTQAQVDQLKAQVDAQKTQYHNVLENTVLKSPITGVVTARNQDPGDMSGSTPILTVGQITPSVKLIISITENDRSIIKAGMSVSVSFDAFPGETIDASISRIYPNIDPATRTFQAEVIVPNRDGRLFPGMFARVKLSRETQRRVVISDRAVVKQKGSGNQYVYVYKNGTVSYNKVELGQRLGDSYELISGVSEGDTIVIAGQSRLNDGSKAQIKK
ncbi:MAG: efflux RND transporter periplasmic adaptor subunit [Muribaculaceae bacterium]|nr:efflux RND transporter periplasmic adaptor subunit [Muribaculaceae bacterium]